MSIIKDFDANDFFYFGVLEVFYSLCVEAAWPKTRLGAYLGWTREPMSDGLLQEIPIAKLPNFHISLVKKEKRLEKKKKTLLYFNN